MPLTHNGSGNCPTSPTEPAYSPTLEAMPQEDEADVDARIDAAGNAFGALREKIFSSTMVSMKVKKFCYVALILSTLLYGSECWTLTEKLYNRLRNFHPYGICAGLPDCTPENTPSRMLTSWNELGFQR